MEQEHLMLELSRDSEKAMKIILDKYYGILCMYTNNKIQDLDTSRDIVSEVLIKIWTKRKDLANIKLEPYLFTCVKNNIINYKRGKIRASKNFAGYENDENTDNIEDYISTEDVNKVIDNIHKLSPQQRPVIIMHMRGVRITEIAKRMGLSNKTAGNYKSRARTKLKELLK